jgi:hypothetical protein
LFQIISQFYSLVSQLVLSINISLNYFMFSIWN